MHRKSKENPCYDRRCRYTYNNVTALLRITQHGQLITNACVCMCVCVMLLVQYRRPLRDAAIRRQMSLYLRPPGGVRSARPAAAAALNSATLATLRCRTTAPCLIITMVTLRRRRTSCTVRCRTPCRHLHPEKAPVSRGHVHGALPSRHQRNPAAPNDPKSTPRVGQ